MTESWYPLQEDYYMAPIGADVPVRQGDLLETPSTCLDSKGRPWLACLVTHPSCELVTGKVPMAQVCRVRRLKDHGRKHQLSIVNGESQDDEGAFRIAMANTFFLPPIDGGTRFDEPMFADMREVRMAPLEELTAEHRVAALSHDARVHYIRRSLYWRQRWLVALSDVRRFEANRIINDPHFKGPRPEWAPSAS